MSSKARQDLEAWLKTIEIPNSSRVLDIGGSQNPIIGRIKIQGYTEPLEYKILDLKQPHETKQKPDIVMDINVSDTALSDTHEFYHLGDILNAKIVEGYFDTAFCIEVSEYWYNPLKALENINLFLKKGGILYISFHMLYGLHKPEREDCLRYTRYGIEKLLKETGFEIEEMIPKKITEEGRQAIISFYQAEGMKILYNEDTFKEGYLIKAVKIY
jgi:SAM-dependent methyltransferase